MEPSAENSATPREVREMDRTVIEDIGLPGLCLMENAGRAVAAAAAETMPAGGRRVLVLAGKGNNGGDAFVAARHLAAAGFDVSLVYAGRISESDPSGDAGVNLRVLLNAAAVFGTGPAPVEAANAKAALEACDLFAAADLILDGLLGTGARGAIIEPLATLIRMANESAAPIVSIDIPSGLDAYTGEMLGECVRATLTVTFVRPKPGFFAGRGPEHAGRIIVADIGMPAGVAQSVLTRLRAAEE